MLSNKIIIVAAMFGVVCCCLMSSPVCRAQTNDPFIYFTIESQPLDSALVIFSIQADINIIGLNASLNQFVALPINGAMTRSAALDLLLTNTGLGYQFLTPQSISILPAKPIVIEPKEQMQFDGYLEEVVVSATRRSKNLQDTPIAVTAFDQQTLDTHQVKDLRDIAVLVPGLEMINTGQQAAILVQLRGVGTTNITEIADGPVAIHIDGIYSPRSQGAGALLYDIESVEVLRGPQGTLFGRNSSSGSINIYTRLPEFNVSSADISLTVGNYNQTAIKAAINIPVKESLSLRVAGAINQHDAYTQLLDNYVGLGLHYPASVHDLTDYDQALDFGQQGPETADQSSWRVSALWQPLDRFSARVSAERYRDKGTGIAQLDPSLVERGIRATVFDSRSFLDLSNDALRSTFEYHFPGDYTLSYLFGLSTMKRQQIFDADNGRDGSFEQQRTHSSTFRFYSHEIQLLNSDKERLRWVLGAYIAREKNAIVFAVDQQNAGGGRSPVGASSWISDHGGAAVFYAIQPDRRVESLGVFVQTIYDINVTNHLTLGIRYTDDNKSDHRGRSINCRVTSTLGPYIESGSIGPGMPAPHQIYADAATAEAIAVGRAHDNGTNEGIGDEPCWVRQVNDASTTWANTSGLIRYDVDGFDNTMLYGSVSTGFKSGHIQDAGNNAAPETVINYELGVKTQFFNNHLRVNTALYLADYNDLQFSNQDRLDTNADGIADTGGSTVVRNASEATIKGVELEFDWAITDNDRIGFAGTLMDARFERFDIPDFIYGDLFNPYVFDQASSIVDPVDLAGNSPPRTPNWKATLAYERTVTLAGGLLTPRLLATFSDDYFLDIYNRDTLDAGIFAHLPNGGDNLGVQQAYQLFDIGVKFEPFSKQWMIDAFIKNVTDENIKVSSGNFITENGFVATYLPPRTFGVSFNYSFEGI